MSKLTTPLLPDQQATIESINAIFRGEVGHANQGALLCTPFGSGKTLMSISMMKKMTAGKGPCLVVTQLSPSKDYVITGNTHFHPSLKSALIGGATEARIRNWYTMEQYDMIVTNYEMLALIYKEAVSVRTNILRMALHEQKRPTQAKRDVILEFLRDHERTPQLDVPLPYPELAKQEEVENTTDGRAICFRRHWPMIILDEAHEVRTSSGDRFTAAAQLRTDFRLVVTATPFNNSIDDVVSLFMLAGIHPNTRREERTTTAAIAGWKDSRLSTPNFCHDLQQCRDMYMIRGSQDHSARQHYQPFDMIWREPFFNPEESRIYDSIACGRAALLSIMGQRQACDSLVRCSSLFRMLSKEPPTVIDLDKSDSDDDETPLSSTDLALSSSTLSSSQSSSTDLPSPDPILPIDLSSSPTDLSSSIDLSFKGSSSSSSSSSSVPIPESPPTKCSHYYCGLAKSPYCVCLSISPATGTGSSSGGGAPTKEWEDTETENVLVHRNPTKVLMVLKYIREVVIPRKEKVVVFCEFLESVAQLKKHITAAFSGFTIFTASGKTHLIDRDVLCRKFANVPGPAALLCTNIFNQGINLPCANHTIRYDSWWNPVVNDQALGRTERPTQTRSVFTLQLLIADTIEENIWMVAHEKRLMAKAVLFDAITESLIANVRIDDEDVFARTRGQSIVKMIKDSHEFQVPPGTLDKGSFDEIVPSTKSIVSIVEQPKKAETSTSSQSTPSRIFPKSFTQRMPLSPTIAPPPPPPRKQTIKLSLDDDDAKRKYFQQAKRQRC